VCRRASQIPRSDPPGSSRPTLKRTTGPGNRAGVSARTANWGVAVQGEASRTRPHEKPRPKSLRARRERRGTRAGWAGPEHHGEHAPRRPAIVPLPQGHDPAESG